VKKKSLRVALVQQPGNSDKNASLEFTVNKIKEAAAQGAELVLLQELHANLYFCQSENKDFFQLAETIPGPTTHLLSDIAKQLKVVIVSSIFEKRAVGLYHNTAVVFEKDGSIAGKYRKMHIPDEPGYSEKYYFAPGDLGFNPIKTSVGNLGVLVCWDQWYPEGARVMALRGADILLYPTAIGWYPSDSDTEKNDLVDAWVTVQRGHSIANCLPVMACNRVGFEASPNSDGMLFWGNSFVTDSHGKILKQASREKSEVLIVDIDMTETEKKRHVWPYLRDRRTDAYEVLLDMYGE
jgi:N-carbamoylputrescine amidase